MSHLLVAVPEYHQQPVEAKTFLDFADLFTPQDFGPGPLGLWELASHEVIPAKDARRILRDRETKRQLAAQAKTPASKAIRLAGEDFIVLPDKTVERLLSREWLRNVVTDVGATAMLKNVWNNAGSAVAIMNQVAIDTAAGSTTLTTALTNGQTTVTSLAVASLPGAIQSGTVITLGYGTGTTQNVTTSALANAAATSISVTSFTSNAAYAIGTNVVPNPSTADNPSSLSGTVAYSGALAGGAFVFSGTGAGNRQVVITYTFTVATTAGNYNEAWTCNTNPVAGAGQTANHLIGVAQPINSTTSLTITITEKL